MKLKTKHRFPSSVLLRSFFGPSWVLLWVPGPVFFRSRARSPFSIRRYRSTIQSYFLCPHSTPLGFPCGTGNALLSSAPRARLCQGSHFPTLGLLCFFGGRRNGGGEKRTTRKKIMNIHQKNKEHKKTQMPRLENAVRSLVDKSIAGSRERLERAREARETPKHLCVICGRSKDTEWRFQSNPSGGYIHASCAKETYFNNMERTDAVVIKSPCALCTGPVTDRDERVKAVDDTTYIHLLCVKEAHETMEPR